MVSKLKALLLENRTTKQTVAKNTFWLTFANFGGKLIKAIVIIYAARVLGTSGYGVFSYAVTLASFFTLFMDPGLNGILMREASKSEPGERRRIFDTMLAMKLVLVAAGAAVITFVAPLFTTLPGAKPLLVIVAVIMGMDTLQSFLNALIMSQERMEWYALITILTNVGITVFGFAFLIWRPTAFSFGWGYVLGDLIGTATAVVIVRNYLSKFLSFFSRDRIMPILRVAWPFALSGAFGLLFTSSDILIISWLRSAADVGIYSAAIRIIQTLYMIPGVIQLSTLPLFARLAKKDDQKFRTVLEQTLSMVFFASIPLSLGGMILGTPIMSFVFGRAYAPGGVSLTLLSATLMFDFSATVVINALFAYNHQRSLAISSAFAGVVNVGLDLLLIPIFGITGSAISTLVAQIANNSYLWHSMRKLNDFSIMPHLRKIITASAVMGAATVLFATLRFELLVNIFLSAVIYFAMLRMLREPLLIELKRVIFPPQPAAPAAPAALS